MNPAAPESSTIRLSLAELAAQGPDQLVAELRRALPGDQEQRPRVAAFNSSI